MSNLFKLPTVKVKHKDVELYDGELYVLTGKATFSSANWFGVVFQDNQIGTIVGEATGNAPTSFGYPLTGYLPNTGLRVGVSHVKWTRPNKDLNEVDALYPDVQVLLTREDLCLDRDPVVEWFLD